jgi:hypothetical protein
MGYPLTLVQSFRLKDATIAIECDDLGKENAAMVPAGGVVSLEEPMSGGPGENRSEMIRVSYNGRRLKIFLLDLQARGESIPSDRAKSASPQ